MNYIEKQMRDAQNNYNYFFIKLIFSILKDIFKLSVVFVIGGFFSNFITNIFMLFFTIYIIYNIISICNYYIHIIKDIKNTIDLESYVFEIDFKLINFNIFRGVIKYGR